DGTELDMTKDKNSEKALPMWENGTPTKLRDCGKACEITTGGRTKEAGYSPLKHRSTGSQGNEISTNVHLAGDDLGYKKTVQEHIRDAMYDKDPSKYGNEKPEVEKAMADYRALDKAKRNEFDEEYQLNRYARPELGEGIMGSNMGYDPDNPKTKYNASTGNWENVPWYNYHFATNVMEDGTDYIALEGLVKHSRWFFTMYGDEGQSFHDRRKKAIGGGEEVISTVVHPDR
ncbi:MAG: hypothetical protein AAF570_21740, partial [Bacteroidota bacterium]